MEAVITGASFAAISFDDWMSLLQFLVSCIFVPVFMYLKKLAAEMASIAKQMESICEVLSKIEIDLGLMPQKPQIEHLHQDVLWNKRLMDENKERFKSLESSVRRNMEKKC